MSFYRATALACSVLLLPVATRRSLLAVLLPSLARPSFRLAWAAFEAACFWRASSMALRWRPGPFFEGTVDSPSGKDWKPFARRVA